MKKALIIIVVLVALVGAGAAYFYLHPSSSIQFTNAPLPAQGQSDQTSDASAGASSTIVAELPTIPLSQSYANPTYSFSFNYPAGFHVGDVSDENGDTVLVQDTAGHIGFQIYISAYSGDPNITPTLIAQSLPDLHVTSPQPVNLASGGQGLAFLSDNSSLGNSREVWFVFKGNLYQISAYQSQDALLQRVLNTWNFTTK